MKLTRIFMSVVAIAVTAVSAFAQDRKPIPRGEESLYIISAKAGVANIIEGDVTVKSEQAEWKRLIAGDDLNEGDAVKTGADGRAEILLNPGCYLRLGEETEIVYAGNSIYNFKIKLLRGSAIIEASAIDGPITVNVSKTRFLIVEDGLYRFNAGADGKAEVAVRDGKVMLGDTKVKGGKKATLENGLPVVASFNKKLEDSFDIWSKDRAKTLIAANKRLSNKAMKRNGLLTSLVSVWVYDPFSGYRTWLPGYSGFSSPYGGSYSRCNPYWYRHNPWGNGNSGGWNNGGGTSAGGGQPSGGGGRSGGGGGGRSGGGGGDVRINPPAPRVDNVRTESTRSGPGIQRPNGN